MLLSLSRCSGRVLFQNDNFLIGYITGSHVDGEMDTPEVITRLWDLPVAKDLRCDEFNPSRYPRYIFINKYGGVNVMTGSNNLIRLPELEEIEQASYRAAGQNQDELNKVLMTLRAVSMRHEKEPQDVYVGKLFTCCLTNENNEISWTGRERNIGVGEALLSTVGDTFSIQSNVADNPDLRPNCIYFVNEFEIVQVPTENADDENEFSRVIAQVRKRQKNRINGDYIVYSANRSDSRKQLRIASVKSMTTKDMMDFFQSDQKSNTKLETLKVCCGIAKERHAENMLPVGKTFMVQLNTQSLCDSPYEFVPVDRMLLLAPHLQVISSDQPEPDMINCMVKVVEDPVDDFVNVLYAALEAGKELAIATLSERRLDKVLKVVRTKLTASEAE